MSEEHTQPTTAGQAVQNGIVHPPEQKLPVADTKVPPLAFQAGLPSEQGPTKT